MVHEDDALRTAPTVHEDDALHTAPTVHEDDALCNVPTSRVDPAEPRTPHRQSPSQLAQVSGVLCPYLAASR